MLYKSTRVKVQSPDGDTDFDVQQGDSLTAYLFILCLFCVHPVILRISIYCHNDLGFALLKSRSRRYLATYLNDAERADDISLFANNTKVLNA